MCKAYSQVSQALVPCSKPLGSPRQFDEAGLLASSCITEPFGLLQVQYHTQQLCTMPGDAEAAMAYTCAAQSGKGMHQLPVLLELLSIVQRLRQGVACSMQVQDYHLAACSGTECCPVERQVSIALADAESGMAAMQMAQALLAAGGDPIVAGKALYVADTAVKVAMQRLQEAQRVQQQMWAAQAAAAAAATVTHAAHAAGCSSAEDEELQDTCSSSWRPLV